MNNKDILWIFSHKNPTYFPSYVVGGIMPADKLEIQKIIFLEDHDPNKLLVKYAPKILIISKAFHLKIKELIILAKERNIRVISVFDDWHFMETDINKNRLLFNKYIADHSDQIIVKTLAASEIIKKYTNHRSIVIPDCIRYESILPIKKITYPFNISWFGMHSNHDTIKLAFNEISSTQNICKINIITNNIEELTSNLSEYENVNTIDYKIIKWKKSLDKQIYQSDIIIIPYINDQIRYVKSSNRIVDSLNMGRFVIMSKAKQFSEFQDFCYQGNIGDGLNWLKKNEDKAIEKIYNGQRYVKSQYTIDTISNMWLNVINKFK
jgi:hypothetical protein